MRTVSVSSFPYAAKDLWQTRCWVGQFLIPHRRRESHARTSSVPGVASGISEFSTCLREACMPLDKKASHTVLKWSSERHTGTSGSLPVLCAFAGPPCGYTRARCRAGAERCDAGI